MKFYLAVTDPAWFRHLSSLANLDEANFWIPGGKVTQYPVGTPWLFKLKRSGFVVGGGFFRYATQLPVSTAWDYFGEKNGAPSFDALLRKIAGNRVEKTTDATPIGCIMLSDPFFWSRDIWLEVPVNWDPHTQTKKSYTTEDPIGRQLWGDVQARATRSLSLEPRPNALGAPGLITPRLGQGEFRSIVLDAYHRRCAVTGERAIPVLEAAHIVPFAEVKEHNLRNALLLRSDIHRLFDKGYVTVMPDLKFRVSKALRDEFHNGREYYPLEGRTIDVPTQEDLRPNLESLQRHVRTVFRS